MCETGHSETREDMRSALRRLEEALASHQRHLAGTADDPADLSLQVLRRSVQLMQQEADRLRRVLAAA
jgi:hypothetical protein